MGDKKKNLTADLILKAVEIRHDTHVAACDERRWGGDATGVAHECDEAVKKISAILGDDELIKKWEDLKRDAEELAEMRAEELWEELRDAYSSREELLKEFIAEEVVNKFDDLMNSMLREAIAEAKEEYIKANPNSEGARKIIEHNRLWREHLRSREKERLMRMWEEDEEEEDDDYYTMIYYE